MRYKINSLILKTWFCLAMFIIFSQKAQAVPKITDVVKNAASQAKYNTGEGADSISSIVGNIIYPILSLLGVIFLGLTVYAGFLWMTAKGEQSQAQKARDILNNSLIGLIIVVGAYAITYFVLYYLTQGLFQSGAVGL